MWALIDYYIHDNFIYRLCKIISKYTITSKREGKDVPLFYNVEINGDFSIPVSKLDYDMVSVGDKIVIRSFMEISSNCRLYKIEKV